jgi:hypothetical protein
MTTLPVPGAPDQGEVSDALATLARFWIRQNTGEAAEALADAWIAECLRSAPHPTPEMKAGFVTAVSESYDNAESWFDAIVVRAEQP